MTWTLRPLRHSNMFPNQGSYKKRKHLLQRWGKLKQRKALKIECHIRYFIEEQNKLINLQYRDNRHRARCQCRAPVWLLWGSQHWQSWDSLQGKTWGIVTFFYLFIFFSWLIFFNDSPKARNQFDFGWKFLIYITNIFHEEEGSVLRVSLILNFSLNLNLYWQWG